MNKILIAFSFLFISSLLKSGEHIQDILDWKKEYFNEFNDYEKLIFCKIYLNNRLINAKFRLQICSYQEIKKKIILESKKEVSKVNFEEVRKELKYFDDNKIEIMKNFTIVINVGAQQIANQIKSSTKFKEAIYIFIEIIERYRAKNIEDEIEFYMKVLEILKIDITI